MENAEEVMQLLEEFSKTRPKEIPRELEEYLGYVAKTGDPVFQWSLVKNLFREKLINVITDFYESTLTVELPPCPNVEPFSYERMKAILLERFDSFASAPFTVQRICELLTNPRKEYNRADKYMRAIEKNVLVVSTREPGTGKRPFECDGQTETVLNGMPEMKFSDGSLLHIPTDLPYLGAPPASNDVTVETTEPTSTKHVSETLDLGSSINGESAAIQVESNKHWQPEEQSVDHTAIVIDSSNKSDLTVEKSQDRSSYDRDSNNKLLSLSLNNEDKIQSLQSESSSILHTQQNETVLPDTGIGNADSSDSLSQDCVDLGLDVQLCSKPIASIEDSENGSDENEVSSTPTYTVSNKSNAAVEGDEPIGSEAEATGKNSLQCSETELSSLDLKIPDNEVNSSDKITDTNETEVAGPIVINEVDLKPTESSSANVLDLECNESEITDANASSVSISSNVNFQTEDGSIDVVECAGPDSSLVDSSDSEQADLHPDSSADVGLRKEAASPSLDKINVSKPELEADSASNTILDAGLSNLHSDKDTTQDTPDQTNMGNPTVTCANVTSPRPSTTIKASPDKIIVSELSENNVLSSNSVEDSVVTTVESCSYVVEEELNPTDSMVSSGNETTEVSFCQEKREESVIQSLSSVSAEILKEEVVIDEISVDPICETEEEAMDVDDSSNQMMVSEGENESEPMDQSDQQQS